MAVEDSVGNIATTSSVVVALNVTGPSGFSETFTGSAINGLVSFGSGLVGQLSVPGVYTYTASSSGLTNAVATETVLPDAYTFSPQPVGATSAATTVTLAFNTFATLGTIQVVTQGVTGLDFKPATPGAGACAVGTTYSPGQTCTVNVVFAPMGVGQRKGAVLLYDNSSTPNLLATAFLSGTGNGGLLNFSSTPTTVASGLGSFSGFAMDTTGNFYLGSAGIVKKLPVGCAVSSCETTVYSGTTNPLGLAVDGAGNVYIANVGSFTDHIGEVPVGGGTLINLPVPVGGFFNPSGVAVDGSGNVYVADTGDFLIQVPSVGQVGLTFQPIGVTVDGAGNVYACGTGPNGPGVVKITAGTRTVTAIGSGFSNPVAVAVDGAGNVYVADKGNSSVVEVPAGGGAQTTFGSGLSAPTGVAVDGSGTVYIGDSGNGRVLAVQQTQLPPTVNFDSMIVGASGAKSLAFTNIGNTPLTLLSATLPNQYKESDTCGGAVAVNSICTLNLTFTPTTGSVLPGTTIPGTLTLTDNATNSPQVINLTGNAVLASLAPTLQPETEVYGQPFSAIVTLGNMTAGTATGTITFTAGGKTVCTFTGSLNLTPTTCNAPNSGLSVGNYPVTFNYSGDTHYSPATGSSTLTVTQAPLTVTVSNATRAYGAANPTFASTPTGLQNGDTINVTYATTAVATSGVGTYPITPTVTASGTTNLANYTVTPVAGTLTIGKAPLTVTVNNFNRAYGAANPTFTSSPTGLQNGDTITVTYATSAVATSAPGSYPVTPTVTASGNTNLSNYTVTPVAGTLTISTASLTFTAPPEAEVFGAPFSEILTFTSPGSATPTGTVTFSNGTTQLCTTALNTSSLSGNTITCSASASTLAAGSYSLNYVYSGDANYGTGNGTVALTVTLTPLIITTQPAATTTINSGQTATLTVAATGSSPTYQWYSGTSPSIVNPIVGATGSTFTTPALTAGTSYWVQVSNGAGSASSTTAIIAVIAPAAPAVFPGQASRNTITVPPVAPQLAGSFVMFICKDPGSISGTSNGQTIPAAASPLDFGITCTSLPVTLSTAITPPVNVTIQTTSGLGGSASVREISRHPGAWYALMLPIPGFLLFGFAAFHPLRRKLRCAPFICLGMVSLLLFGTVSCGGHFIPPASSQSGGGTRACSHYCQAVLMSVNGDHGSAV